MQLRHISPRSSDWMDAMDEGGRGWEKLAPEERSRLRQEAQAATSWQGQAEGEHGGDGGDDYGWGDGSASR
jgi:hypothetical protein